LFEFELKDNSSDNDLNEINDNKDKIDEQSSVIDNRILSINNDANLFISESQSIRENNLLLKYLVKNFEEMKEELKKFKEKPKKSFSEGRMLSLTFVSADQKVSFSLSCKSNEKFYNIENLLYEKYPEYIEYENYFLVNGNKLNRNKTLEENHIRDHDTIVLNVLDF